MIPKLDPAGYRNLVRFSQRKHLLVEGRSDRLFFEYLRYNLGFSDQDFDIDTAEDIIQSKDVFSNREKVEQICDSIVSSIHVYNGSSDRATKISDKLVGFVDREFRDFDLVPQLRDGLNTHKLFSRLVWSRGHSIENYLFDYVTLKDAFITLSSDVSHEALELFLAFFDSTLCLACALSLLGHELQILQRIRASLNTSVVELIGSRVNIDPANWQSSLYKGQVGNPATDINVLLEKLGIWLDHVEASDRQVLRWVCDGHLGLSLLWIVYELCLRRTGQVTLQGDTRIRFNVCARLWAMNVTRSSNKDEYPLIVFDLMGLM